MIPLVPIDEAGESLALIAQSRAFDRLSERFEALALRAPIVGDALRWHTHTIGGRTLRFAQPLTLTPYASARPCSARCRFCSETLVDETASGTRAAGLRPGPHYFAYLRAALEALRGVPLSYSLSGLESTDDPDWLVALLDMLGALRVSPDSGPAVEGAVMYTNGAGFVRSGPRLIDALDTFGVSWLEWSRHHDDAAANQRVMRFRDGERIAQQAVFVDAIARVAARCRVKLVCVVQRGAIETAADVKRYLDWAHGTLGVQTVIFREFSALPAHYRNNGTRRYVDTARVAIDDLLLACIEDRDFTDRYRPYVLTGGYYFWNARWQRSDGREVVFERSDYGAMLAREASGLVYKLVFHANGNLCTGWQPDRGVVWSPEYAR